jgi:hypothetical protein
MLYRLGLGALYAVRNAGMVVTYPALIMAESIELFRKYETTNYY